MMTDTDHNAALDRLTASTWDCSVETTLIEAQKLLVCVGMEDAARALAKHRKSIVNRTRTHYRSIVTLA